MMENANETILRSITAGIAKLARRQRHIEATVRRGIVWTTPPLGPLDSGVAGQMAYDTNFLYVCTATDTWTRIPLTW